MIHPQIEWPKGFTPATADGIVSNEVVVKEIVPEELWPYLINISDWNRFASGVMDATFIDPSIQDPHLFPKVEFTYRTAGMSLAAHVLEAIPPKDDRAGRISWEGAIKGEAGKEFSFVQAWLIVMAPDHGSRILTEMVVKGSGATDEVLSQLHDINGKWIEGLVEYTRKHLVETNHPRFPDHGPVRGAK